MNINTLIFTVTMVLSWILVVFALCLVPFYSRKSTAFGISIPESEYHSGYFIKLRRLYFIIMLALGIVLGAGSLLTQIWLDMNVSVWIQVIAMLFYVIISFAIYLVFYFKVRSYKQNSNWELTQTVYAALTVDKKEKKPIKPLWFLSYAAIIIGTFAVSLIHYPSLPEKIPMHYNIAGQVDRYAAKSIGSILMMPIIQIIMAFMFIGIYYSILIAKNQGSGEDADESLKKGREFKAIMSKFIFFIGLGTMLIFGITQLSMLELLDISVTLAVPVIFLLLTFVLIAYLSVKVGQGGSRIGNSKRSQSKIAANDDGKWVLGIFYYNKDDPSIFVEKRFGMGYTMNIGNPIGLIIIIAILILIVGSLILPFVLH